MLVQTGYIYHSYNTQTKDMMEVAQIVLDKLKPSNSDFSFIFTVKYGVTYQVTGNLYKEKDYGLFIVSSFGIKPVYVSLQKGKFIIL